MPRIRIGTFNCENLFVRYNFSGPTVLRRRKESTIAYERRRTKARLAAKKEFEEIGAPLYYFSGSLENYSAISHTQRQATARVILKNDPDVVALMEVESMAALRKFNASTFFGKQCFPYFLLIDGNDPRGIDVAVLSKHPVTHVQSYVWEPDPADPTRPLFSRDCLVVRVEHLETKVPITLFINHFKSQYRDNPDKRCRQAERVARIVEETFPESINVERFVVLGDFNQVPSDTSLQPLLSRTWHREVMALADVPSGNRWTHVSTKGGKVKDVSQLDYILLSKALADSVETPPIVEQRGLARYPGLDQYYADTEKRIMRTVQGPGTEASDHCPVFIDVHV